MDRLKRKQYTVSQLDAALMAITNGASIYETSKKFGIPRTTLRDKRDNKYSNENCGGSDCFHQGRRTSVNRLDSLFGKIRFSCNKRPATGNGLKISGNIKAPEPI